MNRNTEAHFAETPSLNISRSKFDRSFTHKSSFNVGDLVPFFCTDILPGDTVKMNTAHVVRMMTPITPVMDNMNFDTYFFFVPNRLIWDHWQEFMGENKTAPWIQQQQYTIPQIESPATTGWTKGSLADYFGYPTEVPGYKADAMPFRAYALIYNEWFRSEVTNNPLYIHTGDADITGVDITDANLDPITDIEKGACCAKAARTADYFSMALPNAQKGPAVKVPLGDTAPIVGSKDYLPSYVASAYDPDFVDQNVYLTHGGGTLKAAVSKNGTEEYLDTSKNIALAADLSAAVGATVNQLRQAFQIQKFYERQAIGGTRYIELLKSHFSVTNPDYRMQRPEYLGGMRTPININQVVQTDATSQQLGGEYVEGTWVWDMKDLSPQGNTSAYSLTTGNNKDLFTHSFTEHGWLIGVCVCRLAAHTYQQGLNRMFSRKDIFDFFWPEFANLGNQAIKNKEIFLQGPSAINPNTGKEYDEEVFGYQEAFAEYRYLPDIVSGEMRSNYSQSLDIWHWADYYDTMPTLSDQWMDEPKSNVARTLAVNNHDQLMGDFYFNCIMTRPMPLYSVPGLIDHH